MNEIAGPAAPPPPPATEAELAAPATDPQAADQLGKDAIVAGMSKAKEAVSACFDRFRTPGRADVVLTILRSGRPANVLVRGDFASSPTGNCVATAVATNASFAQYSGGLQQITYPFILR